MVGRQQRTRTQKEILFLPNGLPCKIINLAKSFFWVRLTDDYSSVREGNETAISTL